MPARRLGVVLAATLVTSILSGSFAVARADTKTISDPNDAHRGADIKSVEAGHGSKGRFRYRITTYDGFDRSDAPCLRVQSGLQRRGYRLCGTGVVRRANGKKAGRANVSRPGRFSIVYSFKPKAIGLPSFHRWRAYVAGARCSNGVCDTAPDGRWVTHARKMTYEGWAKNFLAEMKAPRCENNRIVAVAWEVNEGTAAVWNPLATTYSMPGATRFNSVGVKNYPKLGVGLDGTRLTIERGFRVYGYGAIVRKLRNCANPMKTARAIKRSSWCPGCSGGHYVTGLTRTVKADYAPYANRRISTAL